MDFMKLLLSIVCAYLAVFAAPSHATSNSSTVAKWSFGSYFFHNNASLEFQVTVTSPLTPGVYPVIFFLTGFDGLCPTDFYSEFLTDIVAEKNNAITIGLDKLQFIKLPDKEESVFEVTLNWAVENINGIFNSDATPAVVKNKVFPNTGPNGYTLLSHSSAGHPVCLYLKKNCGQIKKLVLMDPVDGYDPFGIVKSYCTTPPEQLPFDIPTLIIANGLDPYPGLPLPGVTGCAPNNISNNRFYEALPGPTIYLNFTKYGHADVLDEWIRNPFASAVCRACDKEYKDCNFPVYRRNLANAVSYFIQAVDQKDPTYLSALQNPQKSGLFDSSISLTSKYQFNGFDILKTGAFCSHK